MARKEITTDPRIGNTRVGLMVSRLQGITEEGHIRLMSHMVVSNSVNIMGAGSSQKSGILGNPFTFDQKRRALQGLWGGAFRMISLQDIGATDRNTDWVDYVLDRIRTNQLPEPTDYYAGSIHDARWYEERFASLSGEPTYIRGGFKIWENPETGKRIHILDRTANGNVSASEVRSLIEQRDPTWRDLVPEKLWNFYEWEYPGDLRAAVRMKADAPLPGEGAYPPGTKLIVGDDPRVYVLRDDGKWRVRTDAELNKSLGD